MNDDEQDLEESDGDELFDFPPTERKINTQPYDLSVQTLLEQWEGGVLRIPDIQREYVWDNGRASRLIESLVLNIPVPPLYFAETQDARFEVIDGHQRVQSIARFVANEFGLSGLRVLTEHSRKRFFQLPEREQRYLKSRSLRVVIINYDSHPSMKFEVFERLNTGGISLNAQELRNSIYRGTFNDQLKELVTDHHFRTCIATKSPRRRMVDEELILRFFALRDGLENYRPPLKRFLNEYMSNNRDPHPNWLEEHAIVFRSTMEMLSRVLGRQAFRLIDRQGNPLQDDRGRPLPRGVNRALFDAQSLVFSWVDQPVDQKLHVRIVENISRELENDATQDAVRRATGDRRRIFHRLRALATALTNAGVRLNVPVDLDEYNAE